MTKPKPIAPLAITTVASTTVSSSFPSSTSPLLSPPLAAAAATQTAIITDIETAFGKAGILEHFNTEKEHLIEAVDLDEEKKRKSIDIKSPTYNNNNNNQNLGFNVSFVDDNYLFFNVFISISIIFFGLVVY